MKLINIEDKIFIAGHTGMAGSSIKRAFIKKGYQNLLLPNRKELDLTKSESVKKWFEENKPEVVIIAAAKVGGIDANFRYPTEFLLENLKIQNNVIENAFLNKAKRLLFLGSSCIYPKFASQPIEEESLLSGDLEITNEAYAIAKIAGIKLCCYLKRQYNFDAISLMPTNLYGPNDNYHNTNSHVMPALIRKIYSAKINNERLVTCWGTGNPRREFLHADDLADAVLFTLENISKDSEEFFDANKKYLGFLNVGTGVDIKIRNLAELISEKINFKGEIIWDTSKPDGTPRKLLNISRIKRLGWEPKINIEDGIEETVKNYKYELNAKKLRI